MVENIVTTEFGDEIITRDPLKFIDNRKPNAELREAMEDIRLGRNLHGPYATAEEAVRSMLES